MRPRLVLAAATLLGGCAAHPPAPAATRAPAARAQPVYYRPAKAAPAQAQAQAAAPASCIPPAAPISSAQQEELFQRFDQTRGEAAGDDAAAR